jgi:hypothetical protein
MKYIIGHLGMSSEDQCTFVSSRGILKSCDIHSSDPYSSCWPKFDVAHLDAIVANPSLQKPNMSIYVCVEALNYFATHILPHIRHPFVLFSGDSDRSQPAERMNEENQSLILCHPYLICWAGQNMTKMSNNKLLQIPIGLDYHSLNAARPPGGWLKKGEGRQTPGEQEAFLKQLRASAPAWRDRICKVYTNAHHRMDRFGDRKAMTEQIHPSILVLEPGLIPRSEVWKKYTEYAFVASPFGNGVDCHRTWEALCCGAIPIIRGNFLKDIYDDLPVLRVKDWSDVTEDLLKKTVEDFSQRTFNYEKLTLAYWCRLPTAVASSAAKPPTQQLAKEGT